MTVRDIANMTGAGSRGIVSPSGQKLDRYGAVPVVHTMVWGTVAVLQQR